MNHDVMPGKGDIDWLVQNSEQPDFAGHSQVLVPVRYPPVRDATVQGDQVGSW